jgi:preprotein translocase subunit SecB
MAKFKFLSSFLKKIHFDSPSTPELFFKQENTLAKMDITIDIQIKSSENNLYMVDLIIGLNSMLESGKVVFKIDLVFSGLVQIEGAYDEEELKCILLIDIPHILFPDARSLILNITAASGFPPFQMQVVDFKELYNVNNAKGRVNENLEKDKLKESEALRLLMLHSSINKVNPDS